MTSRFRSTFSKFSAAVAVLAILMACAIAADAPKIGGEARDFELPVLGGEKVKLSKLTESGPVVLVVLRGNPGYQCPLCTKQFGEFLGKADEFKKAGAQVVFVYPGPADKLKEKAGEFVKGKDYPAHFTLLLDPDYTFTTAYGLRWDAKNETAYPSTFVIDGKRKVTFAKVSTTHGDRSKVGDVLAALGGK
jgi:thioredoxin-dependent peroxiredoxin